MTQPNSPTARLASFIADATIPRAVRDKAKKAVADTVGVMLSGVKSEVAPPLLRYLRGQHAGGASAVLGTNLTAPPEVAALINGTFGHAMDFDDGIVSAPVHPSSVVIATLLSNTRELSGEALLDAYVVGVEVSVKLATAIGIEHYHRGWHGTGTLGVFGAVAALARARRLDPAVTQVAFGLASSMTSGIQRNFGTMTKPFHTGWAARSGVVAVELACSGFTAAADALEANSGFFAVYGNANSNMDVLLGLGDPYAIDDPGLSLKRYACCYASHRPMEGVLALRSELGLTPDNLAGLRCLLAPGSTRALIYSRPVTGLEAKFSLEYALAAGVLDGAYSLWSFTDEAVARPAVQDLLPRISTAEDPRCAIGDPHAATRGPSRRGYVEVHAETRDGRRAVRRIDKLPGSPDQALTWDDIRSKFLDCASSADLDAKRSREAFDRLAQLEECADVSEICTLLRP
jgi:2-methylcitrate dehydratase PrpD